MKRSDELPVDIWVLSAKYGLIRLSEEIEPYDQKMSIERACELRVEVLQSIGQLFRKGRYKELFINLGPTYMETIKGLETLLPRDMEVVYAKGRIGERTAQTKLWLERVARLLGNR